MTTAELELGENEPTQHIPASFSIGGGGLDLSYLNAATLMVGPHESVHIMLVGCGGTGSWLAPHIARIARVLVESGKPTTLSFIDPDIVEKANVYRQNFCDAEVGYHKSRVLAMRYGAAWGVEIGIAVESFRESEPNQYYPHKQLTVMIGCVDNAAARQSLMRELKHNNEAIPGYARELPKLFWLDCGNAFQSGQVILGSNCDPTAFLDEKNFGQLPGYCTMLPAPSLVEPSLLVARPEEFANASELSCEEMAARNLQSLTINQQIAGIAADYLLRLLLPGAGGLKRFATYIDMASGVARSKYITPEAIQTVVGEAFVAGLKSRKTGRAAK
jgi:PRTRC genetic system ThiF family protein